MHAVLFTGQNIFTILVAIENYDDSGRATKLGYGHKNLNRAAVGVLVPKCGHTAD